MGEGIRAVLSEFLDEREAEKVVEAWLVEDLKLVQGHYMKYKDILREGLRRGFTAVGLEPIEEAIEAVIESVARWPPFPDTRRGLELLRAQGHRLYVISNMDVDLLDETARNIGFNFDGLFAAEEVREYKPSLNVFRKAYEKFGVSLDDVLHVSFSPEYDLKPAKKLGLRTAYMDRKGIPLPHDVETDYVAEDLIKLSRILTSNKK